MDFTKFALSLTKYEKEVLFSILKADLQYEGGAESLVDFFERKNHEGTMSVRLANVWKSNIRSPIMAKSLRDVNREDLFQLRGVGRSVWEEFAEIRGY